VPYAQFNAFKADWLGRVDGFDQEIRAGEGNEGGEVLRSLLAAQSDPFEVLDFADAVLDAGAPRFSSTWRCGAPAARSSRRCGAALRPTRRR
jgi:hypothetical protein